MNADALGEPDDLRHALARAIAGRLWDEIAEGRKAGNGYGTYTTIPDTPRADYVRSQGRSAEFLQDADALIAVVNRYVPGKKLMRSSRPVGYTPA